MPWLSFIGATFITWRQSGRVRSGKNDDAEIVHWSHELREVPRRTESADKSDALQTLRAVRRRPAVAQRLECVRLQRRFPKAGWDSVVGRFMESPHDFDAVHWDHEPRTSRTVPPTRCCRRLVGRAFRRFLCRQDAGSTLRIMERTTAVARSGLFDRRKTWKFGDTRS